MDPRRDMQISAALEGTSHCINSREFEPHVLIQNESQECAILVNIGTMDLVPRFFIIWNIDDYDLLQRKGLLVGVGNDQKKTVIFQYLVKVNTYKWDYVAWTWLPQLKLDIHTRSTTGKTSKVKNRNRQDIHIHGGDGEVVRVFC